MPRRPDVKIKIKGVECTATLWDFDSSELKKLREVFNAWTALNEKIDYFGTRWSNLNEIISEGAASYFLKFPRVEKDSIKIVKLSKEEARQRRKDQSKYIKETFGKEKKKDLTKEETKEVNKIFLPKPSKSWDCYDEATNETVQIKASVGVNEDGVREHDDLTSFGPRSQFDKLFFLDFYSDGNVDGWFDVYIIPLDVLYNTEVKDGVTLREKLDAQASEKEVKSRPHFSLRKKVIIPNGLKPLRKCNLMQP